MIHSVNILMSAWGKWVVRQTSKGLGYSTICPMFKQAQHGGVFGSSVPVGVEIGCIDEIIDCDKAVKRMTRDQIALAHEFYVIGGKSVDIAARIGVSKKRMYDRINAMHEEMVRHLNDVASGENGR